MLSIVYYVNPLHC
uniref:Uncharacterized protein n=1 Tax=Anguilla anguilla TaxID=7936 RepID=A0A0E9S093_ANGAN